MGLLETVLERVSVKSVAMSAVVLVLLLPVLAVGFICWDLVARVVEGSKLKKLGGRAPGIPSHWPLGLDTIHRTVKATMTYKNLELWRDFFAEAGQTQGQPQHTTETRLFGRRAVFTADPENIKAILATQFDDFGKGEPFHREWRPFLGDSIFTTDGAAWHASRQLLRPQFVRDRVSDLHCFETHMVTLFRAIAHGGPLDGENQGQNQSENQETAAAAAAAAAAQKEMMYDAVEAGRGGAARVVDINDLFCRFSIDTATDFLLGMDLKSLSTPREPFAEAFMEVQRVQSIMARAGTLRGLVPLRTYWASMRIVDDTINRYIDRALMLSPAELETKAKGEAGYTFLHALAGFTRDRRVLRDQIIAVLLAGRDTTAATLSWALYELGRHPEVVARMRAEILATTGSVRAPTYADLKAMKYVQNVVAETLRVYPVVPFNVRLALRDTTLPRGGGADGSRPVAVLKDTPIGYSPLVLQRRPDLYPPASADFPHPELWAPDRWSGAAAAGSPGTWQPKPWQYVPFNGGPRICIGQQFALAEMAYVLTRLFQRFDRVVSHMDAVDGGRPNLKAEVVLQPGDGVLVSFYEPVEERVRGD